MRGFRCPNGSIIFHNAVHPHSRTDDRLAASGWICPDQWMDLTDSDFLLLA